MIVPEELLADIRELLEGMQDINGSGGPNAAMQLLTRLAHECSKPLAVGLFWQTSDHRWHFSAGSTNVGDIHDNGRPIHVAYLGESARK